MFLTFGIEDIIGVDFDFEARRNIVIQYVNIELFETVAHVRGEMNTPLECRWLCVEPVMLIVSSCSWQAS